MGVHKEVVFSRTITQRLVFNVTNERKRIADCGKSDIEDGHEYGLPDWVVERMTLVCDAIESGNIEALNELYHKSLYNDRRHNDTVIAEYFPEIVDELLSAHFHRTEFGSDGYEIENVQEVMD